MSQVSFLEYRVYVDKISPLDCETYFSAEVTARLLITTGFNVPCSKRQSLKCVMSNMRKPPGASAAAT